MRRLSAEINTLDRLVGFVQFAIQGRTIMTPEERARRSAEAMWSRDNASSGMGIQIDEVGPGHAVLSMTVQEYHLNGHSICHGGFIFTLADSAFAFASNSRGQHAVSIETSISHTRPVVPGDLLYAKATELQHGKTIARYDVEVTCGDHVVALFKGTVFKKDTPWI
jgi:acyl-CoA thioesterase